MSDSVGGDNNQAGGSGLKIGKAMWASIAASLVVIVAVLGYFLISSRDSSVDPASASASIQGGSAYTDQVTAQWNAIKTVCTELTKKEAGVIDQATLDSFSVSVGVAAKRVDSARKEIEAISPVPGDYRDKHLQLTASIASLNDYLTKLQALTGKPAANVALADFSPVDTAGIDARKKTDAAADAMGFLERLPQPTFTLQTDLLAFYQSVWEKSGTPQRPASSLPAPQPGSSQPSQAGAPGPDDAINYFNSYYISGDGNGMSQVMIGQAASDFNSQSSAVAPFYSEILEGPYQQGGNYVYKVMYEFRVDTGPYLEDWTMVVSQQGSAFYITGANLELRTEYTDN